MKYIVSDPWPANHGEAEESENQLAGSRVTIAHAHCNLQRGATGKMLTNTNVRCSRKKSESRLLEVAQITMSVLGGGNRAAALFSNSNK